MTEHTNTVLDPDYLDAMVCMDAFWQSTWIENIFKVQKMLCGKHGIRFGFLRKRTHPNLKEDEVGLRRDIAREWNHIYETVFLSITIFCH